ncbi:MAG: hypothetical protein K9I85_13685 [Saprospiraceae bacterium]|nr:hypothetical protein [Saprospiraceae bacterium]
MHNQPTSSLRANGYFVLIGAVTMLIGAALWGSTGTDLWAALAEGTMAEYLTAVSSFKTQLVANTSFWSAGVILLGLGITGLAESPSNTPALNQIASFCARTGVVMGLISFMVMLSLTMQIAPDTSPAAIQMAHVVGWIGTRLDDVATILIIGVGSACLSLAGRDTWVPGWLKTWGLIAGLVGIMALAGLFIPSLADMAFLLVPAGIGWMIAAGITAIRKK